ncbi:MAG: LuxR C-terminal-related transcriptional regulator [Coriobacteriaceae bacterium]
MSFRLVSPRLPPRAQDSKALCRQLETSEVAERLFISIHTARKHNANIYRKLNVSSREKLIALSGAVPPCKLDALFGEGALRRIGGLAAVRL